MNKPKQDATQMLRALLNSEVCVAADDLIPKRGKPDQRWIFHYDACGALRFTPIAPNACVMTVAQMLESLAGPDLHASTDELRACAEAIAVTLRRRAEHQAATTAKE
ncbi:hypothetical protein [Pseudomonas spirodelae]|uniref:Uncharacterized protein n=1 Tax=Pseudomonas spirodelae TaxID=3101751 RepID=A0ABU5P6B8_9PSED|nr:hypothetical protein [Pseudomonas sp. T5W1]MEA1605165.1 hypothetical protein [Pseudomonas sp. T5W1]